MKILHLSDMHLGKIVLEQSMLEDQEYMLKQIIEKIKQEKIELVLIAGDIYDRSIPPSEAVTLLDNFLKTLIKDLKIKVCMISGNHDSKERLSFGKKIFESEGLYIETDYQGTLKKVTLEDQHGPLNIYMLPYIKPIEVKRYFEPQDNQKQQNDQSEKKDNPITTYHQAVKSIIEKEQINETQRNIILSHQFVTAGTQEPDRCDSETLNLGGTENVDITCYDPFDYVALGHIHGPQRISRETARYAGTMLKYSFSEVNHKKSLTIIDIKEKNQLEIKQIPLKPLRDMRQIKGPIEELLNPKNYENTNTEDYISAIITNDEPIYDAIGQIKKIYPNTLRLDIENTKTQQTTKTQMTNIENLKKKSELELFSEFYNIQQNTKLSEDQTKILEEIIKEIK